MAECNTPVFKEFDGVEIWVYILRSSSGKFAQCKVCRIVLKCVAGSTKGVHVHLKSMHQIDIHLKRKDLETLESDSQIKRTKITTIDNFINDTTLSAVLARMTAYDGLPFSIFITSLDLRKSRAAQGYSVPKSITSIREQVIKNGNHLFERIKHD